MDQLMIINYELDPHFVLFMFLLVVTKYGCIPKMSFLGYVKVDYFWLLQEETEQGDRVGKKCHCLSISDVNGAISFLSL